MEKPKTNKTSTIKPELEKTEEVVENKRKPHHDNNKEIPISLNCDFEIVKELGMFLNLNFTILNNTNEKIFEFVITHITVNSYSKYDNTQSKRFYGDSQFNVRHSEKTINENKDEKNEKRYNFCAESPFPLFTKDFIELNIIENDEWLSPNNTIVFKDKFFFSKNDLYYSPKKDTEIILRFYATTSTKTYEFIDNSFDLRYYGSSVPDKYIPYEFPFPTDLWEKMQKEVGIKD